jgi:hypothetical protein
LVRDLVQVTELELG